MVITLLLPTVVSDANAMLQTVCCKSTYETYIFHVWSTVIEFLQYFFFWFSDIVSHQGLLCQMGKLAPRHNVQAPLSIWEISLRVLIAAYQDVHMVVLETTPSILSKLKSPLVPPQVNFHSS